MTVVGQDSPFWTLDAGGCMKSLKGTSASLSAEQTSEDEHVIHSTKVGYKAITCAHVFPSTVKRKSTKISKQSWYKQQSPNLQKHNVKTLTDWFWEHLFNF